MLKAFLKDESAATVVEYGLIAALIALGMLGGFTSVSNILQGNFESAAGIMEDAF